MTDQEKKERTRKWSQIVAKAWADETFKKRLLAEPAKVLHEYGMQMPQGIQPKIVEDTDRICYLKLPAKPSGELSEEDLSQIAAAGTSDSWCGACGNCDVP
jgi:hypothetical protein